MAVLEIARMGHPILRQVAQPVDLKEVQTPAFQTFLQDMHETMIDAQGIGLAAPQVKVSKQVAIMEIDLSNERYAVDDDDAIPLSVFINPKITVLDESPIGMWEGCLSVPLLRGYVERPCKIRVDYWNEKSEPKSITAEGLPAIVIQHELDHLAGILYVDKLKDTKQFAYIEEYEQFWLSEDDEFCEE